MPQPTTNNLEGWGKLKNNLLADIGAIIMISVMEGKTTDMAIKMRDNLIDFVEQYIQGLRKHDEEELIKLKEALIWCSGAENFQIEGKARIGWEKICKPLLQ